MQKIYIIILALSLCVPQEVVFADYEDEVYYESASSYESYNEEPPIEYAVDDGYTQVMPLSDEDIEQATPHKRSTKNLGTSYASRLPNFIDPAPGERIILIDPNVHAWGAYLPDGKLIRAGLATAGGKWCNDTGRPCRTKAGSFRIFSLGSSDCISSLYPLGEGGAPMPYCMFFNGNQGLHGSNQVTEGNVSHGCVRVSVRDAAWLRYEFANKGTRVIVRPY